MRFSVWPHGRRPWPDLLAVARHAAAAGCDGVWFGDEADPALECWSVVGALAAAVPGVRLGAFIDGDRGRHPAVVAKLAATVDQLTGGRLVLGLADSPDRLMETCQVVTSLLGTARTTFVGRFYRLLDAPLDPKAAQHRLPLTVRDIGGVHGGGATADIAALCATQWSVAGGPESVAHQIGMLHHACDTIGRDPAEVTVSVSIDQLPAEGDVFVRYRDAGVDECILRDPTYDELERIMSEVAPGLR